MLEAACMKDEPAPQPLDNNNSPHNMQPQSAPIANMGMGMGQGGMPQSPMGQANMGQSISSGQMTQNMAQSLAQASMQQANMGQHMDQNIGQSQMGQIDMRNIDPSIGLQSMGNMGGMMEAGRGMNMQSPQLHADFKDEMP